MFSESWNRNEDEWNFCLVFIPQITIVSPFVTHHINIWAIYQLGAFSELKRVFNLVKLQKQINHSIPFQDLKFKFVFWTTQSLFSISHIWSHDIFGYYSNFWSCVETVLLLALPPLELGVNHLPRTLAPGLHLHPWNEQQIKANNHPNQNVFIFVNG